jgi:hypothetical protein
MRTETTRLFNDLLSLHGFVADPLPGVAQAAPQPARNTPASSEESTMNLFKSLWLLGGLQSIDLRVGDDDEAPFANTYGNRLASARRFGKAPADHGNAVRHAPIDAQDQRVAHC